MLSNSLTSFRSTLEAASFVGTAVMPFIALAALVAAVVQIRSAARSTRLASAYNIFQQYLRTTIDHPQLAYGKEAEILASMDLKLKYNWFISNMLLSFEEILITCPREADWNAAIRSQIRLHLWHLSKSNSVANGHWKPALSRLINEEIAGAIKPFGYRDAIPPLKYVKFVCSQ